MLLSLNLGPHAAFIILSYAFTLVLTAALVIWIVLDHRSQRRALQALEDAGIKRRSTKSASAS